MNFKNGFNCKKCPESNGVNGCPCWWEMPWENTDSGTVKVQKGCILSQDMGLPIVQCVVRSAHVASEHMSKAGNVLMKLTGKIEERVPVSGRSFPEKLEQIPE